MNTVAAMLVLLLVAGTVHSKIKYAGMTFTNGRYCPNVSLSSNLSALSLSHLASTGANAVAIVVTQYQYNTTSTDIFPVVEPIRCTSTPSGYCVTPSDAEVVTAIRRAHAYGLKVLLKPHVDLIAAPAGAWRGDIGTNMTSLQWAQWFLSYEAFILHYARIAEREHVHMLSASCELVTASLQAPFWRDSVIPKIRSHYSGLLTDAANWSPPGGHGELTDKTWWDLVDVIGVDEYAMYWINRHEVNGSYPSVQDLLASWAPIETQLGEIHKKWNKSILFTEIGFCSGHNASCFSNSDLPHPPPTAASLKAQADQFNATLIAMSKHSWWEGVFWWNWATDPAFGGRGNSCMDPKWKPAEDVLRAWYGATAPKPAPPSGPAVCECWL